MVEDAIAVTVSLVEASGAASVSDIRGLEYPVVRFSEDMSAKDHALKDFLWKHMYRHENVVKTTDHAKGVVRDLFQYLMKKPETMPPEWRDFGDMGDENTRARVVSDYIAGMTDRFALHLHEQLFT